ncbi:Tetratricopeptide repeat-containing protein [Tangfeifania diversioriginum]|uniref:Tetratricopeptide repeat-containing protein n=1 Tax=Tangfeifania diversioriginum TaxID=1168035 RepID=A0A1M6KVE2_9BACT|nr:tetratricopeptide repeat protein [Tangfeifania diversioriginum]SHJ62832.1 Tetratricopeptide repeat-containing protein [Tangfeifania diversioriginum]
MSIFKPFCKGISITLFFLALIFFTKAGKCGIPETGKINIQIIDSLFALSSSNISINNQIALLYAEKGKELLDEIEYAQGEQKYFFIKAQIAYYDDRYEEALAYLDSLGRILSPDIASLDLGRYYSLKALVNTYLGYHELAIEMNLRAISVYEKLSDFSGMSVCYNAIGLTYLNQGNNELAERYLDGAFDINQKTSDKKAFGMILINKGNLKIAQDSLDAAMELFSNAYDLYLELGDLRRIAISLYNIAKVQSKVGEFTDAIAKLDESLDIFYKLDEKYGQAMVYGLKSEIYNKTGDYNHAIKYGEIALEISTHINSQILQNETYLQLSQAHKNNGDYFKALGFYEDYHNTKADLDIKNNAKRIAEIEYQAQLSANEKDIQLLHQRNRARTLQVYILIVFSSMILLSTLGLILFLRLKNKNLRQKQEILEKKNHLIDLENKVFEKDKKMLENDLELKNKELASRALALIQLNETLKNISIRMNEFPSDASGGRKQIKAILQEIQLVTHHNIWEEFDLAFNNVYNLFYEKLFEICPNLSATEIKIAALLKLNLSTKEIAAISFKSESSIKTARHRLRQKLNMGENDNLVAFLLKL